VGHFPDFFLLRPAQAIPGLKNSVKGIRMLLFHRHSEPRSYKCCEFDVDLWEFTHGIHWFHHSIETRCRQDHGGFFFMAVMLNLKVEFSHYDVRHWNEAAGRYNLESEY
jgi:hypothetical protein